MKDPERVFRKDPVLQEVMRKHHLQWDDFDAISTRRYRLPCSGDRPEIYFSLDTTTDDVLREYLRIEWEGSGRTIRYEVNRGAAVITMRDTVIPQATLHGLIGRSASMLMDIPGFERLIVREAMHRSVGSDGTRELRVGVRNIYEDGTS